MIFLFLFSVPAKASRARVDALQSNHLKDTEFVYLFPTKLLEIPNYILMQSGSTLDFDKLKRPYFAAKVSFGEEANNDSSALGIALGRSNNLIDEARVRTNTLLASHFEPTANPINLNYSLRSLGTSYAFEVFYADQNDKINKVGNHAAAIGLGARFDDFTLTMHAALKNEVDDLATSGQLIVDQSVSTALLFELDDIYFLFDLSSSHAKRLLSGLYSDDLELLDYKMGVIKNYFNGNEILFYRLNLETQQTKNRVTSSNTREIKLPLVLGFESVLTDEIKIRSSIKQIVGVYQTETLGPGENTTTAAVGLGLTFNKLLIDGVFEGLIGSTANQTLNGNQFLTGTSITYWY